MGVVILVAATAGLLVYSLMLALPSFSPRQAMVRRLQPYGYDRAVHGRERGLAARLRRVAVTRRLPARRFRLIQAGLAGTGLLACAAPLLIVGTPPDPVALVSYPLGLWLLPEIWLWLQLRRRRALIARSYPDLLSHLVTQTRAGAGTLQAFVSVPPVLREPLRGEVEELLADLRIAPFPAALERFAQRCDLAEVRAMARHLVYQHSLGIELQEALVAEEAHTLVIARQKSRQRIQGSAIVMASVTIILLLNGLAILFAPLLLDMSQMLAGQ